ncbi:MAG: phosphatase PAP2-related protein [Chitinophagales bacterium]
MELFPTLSELKGVWADLWRSRKGRLLLTFTMGLAFPVFAVQIHCLNIWELREGAAITDKVMLFFKPFDFSLPIFFLIYAVVFGGVFHLAEDPQYLLKGFQAYMLMMVLRCLSIYFLPLQPPPGMILLLDPLAAYFLSSNGNVVTKDLFFSGHTATIFIFYFAVKEPVLKRLIGIAGVLVPLMLVWQHVHYTADVMAAPMVSFFCIKTIEKFYDKIGYPFVWKKEVIPSEIPQVESVIG